MGGDQLVGTTTVTSGVTTLERSIANTYNPFRYRGYFYDVETGWYYLQSRYYNPTWGRFLNADGVAYLGVGDELLGYNLYAYCGNNPVMGYDPEGTIDWGKFLGGAELMAIGITAIAVAASVLTCGAAAPAMVAIAAVTITAGIATTVNGVAEVVESATDYNFVRDGMMGGNQEAYETYRDVTKIVAEIGTAITGSYIAAKGGNVCFVAGTPIAAEMGMIPIEDIAVGDMVWASNPETNETELKEVVRLFRNEADELVRVTVNGEEIVCTNEHPFYSPVKGWTAACQLRAGDVLVLLNGAYVVVEKVQHEILETPIAVYNFEVEGFHTYYVGNTSVLVHNKCGIDEFSTGRTKPRNISEQIAMKAAKADPSDGKIIMKELGDKRLDKAAVVKMSKHFKTFRGNFDIHYLWDRTKNVYFDFKFID